MKFRHRYRIPLREDAADPPHTLTELEETRTAASALVKHTDTLLSAGSLPKGLRDQVRNLRREVRKRLPVWDDLELDDDEDGTPTPAVEGATEITTDFVELSEAGGEVRTIKLINPGWGSSGYYERPTLEAAGRNRVFKKGLKMYWNHPTVTDKRERPERDLRDLAAVLEADATWDPSGAKGPGLYAPIRVRSGYVEAVNELAPHIGVSIRADGIAKTGTREGRTGPVIESIVNPKSVDFVTEPGAGGRVLELFESARPATNPPEDGDMGELEEARAKLTALEEAKRTADAEKATMVAALQEANATIARGKARDIATVKLGPSKLPAASKLRLVESATAVLKDGAIDQAATEAALDAAIKTETEYLKSLGINVAEAGDGGGSGVRGMGGRDDSSGGGDGGSQRLEGTALKESQDGLTAAFARMGLQESAAKGASSGR